MDPITGAIIAALAAGVVTGTTEIGKKLLVDAYDALKAALEKKFGENSKIAQAVAAVEDEPDFEPNQATLAGRVKQTQADQDPELAKLAQALIDALKATEEGQQALANHNIQVTQTAGDNAIQIGTAGDVTINK